MSTGSTLGEELANFRNELNGDRQLGVIGRLAGGLVFGDGLLVGLRFIVVEHALDPLRIPSGWVLRGLHAVFLRRRFDARKAMDPRS